MLPDALLDADAAAQRLNITPRHIRALVYRRQIPYVKVGRLVRFRAADLDAWVESRVILPAS